MSGVVAMQRGRQGPDRSKPLAVAAPRGIELDEPVASGGTSTSLGEVLEVFVSEDLGFGGDRSRDLFGPTGGGRQRSRKQGAVTHARVGGNAAWQRVSMPASHEKGLGGGRGCATVCERPVRNLQVYRSPGA